MKLYSTRNGPFVEMENRWFRLDDLDFASLLIRDDLEKCLEPEVAKRSFCNAPLDDDLLAPIGAQEVWAAGVTYFRSRTARMEESEIAGGGSFYDRVYQAERPELFFKSTPHRVVGHRQAVFIRGDSQWNVPEPELTLLITPSGKITGYTIGNDVSSRDIEGENPLYLPQAKLYSKSCALGPAIFVSSKAPPQSTQIQLDIRRNGAVSFSGSTSLTELKRTLESLVDYLFRYNTFPNGCFLLTGTGIIPPDAFSLEAGDEVSITIDGIGTLINPVEQAS